MIADAISHLFTRHTRLWHFWLRDLRSGEVLELGTRRAYPIGSCFKLAVLIAYFEALKDRVELDVPVLIPPERFRIGGGVVSFLDSAVALTCRQMVHFMLAASDGTCTDWLIARLGLPAVNRVLQVHTRMSDLPQDLGDMVAAFRRIPEALDCKTRIFDDGELLVFVDTVCTLGATNAEDLAALALAAWRNPVPASLHGDYRRCLSVRRGVQRTEMFIEPALRCFTKTGSLGYRFFMQDCGVLIDPATRTEIGHFGYCTVGGRLPTLMADVVGGLIGIEIARTLGLNPSLNADYTPEGAALLMGMP